MGTVTSAATIVRSGLEETGPGDNGTQNNLEDADQTTVQLISRALSERTVLILHVGPPPPIKAHVHCWSVGWGGQGTRPWTGAHPPPPPLLASEIKQTFPSNNFASLLDFKWRAAELHFCTCPMWGCALSRSGSLGFPE